MAFSQPYLGHDPHRKLLPGLWSQHPKDTGECLYIITDLKSKMHELSASQILKKCISVHGFYTRLKGLLSFKYIRLISLGYICYKKGVLMMSSRVSQPEGRSCSAVRWYSSRYGCLASPMSLMFSRWLPEWYHPPAVEPSCPGPCANHASLWCFQSGCFLLLLHVQHFLCHPVFCLFFTARAVNVSSSGWGRQSGYRNGAIGSQQGATDLKHKTWQFGL